MLAALDLFVLVFMFFLVYMNEDGVYIMSHPSSWVIVFAFIVVVGVFLWHEFDVFRKTASGKVPFSEKDLNQRFVDLDHTSLFLITTLFLVWFTVMACIDAKRV